MRKALPLLYLFPLLSLTAQAQTFEQLTFLRLNETPISVRGAAMGAVSDDDVSLNPASLATFDRFLFSVGGARSSYRRDFLVQVTPELVTTERRNFNPTELSHAMFAMPVGSFTVGAWYRSEPDLRDAEPFLSGTADPFEPSVCPGEGCVHAFLLGAGSLQRREQRYGAAFSWERGPLSIGAGAEVQDLDESADLLRTRFTLEPTIYDRVLLRTAGREIVPHAGVRWQVAPRVAVAASYKGAGTFRRTSSACMATGDFGGGCASQLVLENESKQQMADSYRASISVRPIDRLEIIAEGVRRNYSKLDDDANLLDAPQLTDRFKDATELHAGAEYRLGTVALRGGWWRDPARHRGFGINPLYELAQRRDHVTFGAGVDVGAARVDVAFDDVDDPALRRASIGLRFESGR